MPCAEQTSDGTIRYYGHSALFSAPPGVEHLEHALGVLSMSKQQPVHHKWLSVLPGIQAGTIQPHHFSSREEHDTVKVIHQNKPEHICSISSFHSHFWPLPCDPGEVTTSSYLKFSGVRHLFTLHLAQQGLNVNPIQTTRCRCMLPTSLLPVMVPITGKKCWLFPWMEGHRGHAGVPYPCASGSTVTQELLVLPCKAKGPFPNLWAKSVIILFGHTSISLAVAFYTSRSSSKLIDAYLPSTGSFRVLARVMSGFISSSFRPSSPPHLSPPNHHSVHLQQQCKLQKLFVFHGHSHIMPKWWPKSLAGNLNPRIRELMMNGCEAFVIVQAPLWLEQWRRTQVWLRRATDKTVGENGGLLPTWPLVDIERIQKQVSRNRNDSVRRGY